MSERGERPTTEHPTEPFIPDMTEDAVEYVDSSTPPASNIEPKHATIPETGLDEPGAPLTTLPEVPKFRMETNLSYERALEALKHFLKTVDPDNEQRDGGSAALVLDQLEDVVDGIAPDKDALIAHGLGDVLALPPEKISELLRDPRLHDVNGEEMVQDAAE